VGKSCRPFSPLVLYNGRQRWNAARDVSELIDLLPGSLRRYHPAHRYFLLDESAVGEEHLADRQNTVTSIIRLETSAVPADVRQAVSQLQQRLQGPQYASLRRAFVVWINRIVLRRLMPGQEVPEVNELQEIDTMLAETVEEWTRQWKADGLQQGRLQGLQEGRRGGIAGGKAGRDGWKVSACCCKSSSNAVLAPCRRGSANAWRKRLLSNWRPGVSTCSMLPISATSSLTG
jgi:hypothetical protein